MKSNKKGTISINLLIILTMGLVVVAILYFLVFGMPKPLEAIFSKEPAGHDDAYMNIMKTEPLVYVGSGWTCSKEILEADENGEYYVKIYFDKTISKENLEGFYDIYRDKTLLRPGKEDQWINYDYLVQGAEKNVKWPEIEYEITDDGKALIFGPFPKGKPKFDGHLSENGRGFYYMIVFKTDGKSESKSFISKDSKYILNPRMRAVKFRTP
jgi:hypothetical protein